MRAQLFAKAVHHFVRDRGRPISVYVGPNGAIGYSEANQAREWVPMKLAGTYDENASEAQIAADLTAAGMP